MPNDNFNFQSNLSPKMNQLLLEGISPQPAMTIRTKKNIPTSSVLQNLGSPNISQSIQQPIQEFATPPVVQPAIQPEIPSQEEQDNSRFLASLLGQGVAMLGAGIAGRDPMRAGEIISDQRAYQERLNQQQKIQKEQKDLADNLMNPTSKQSERKRLLYSRALGIDIPEDVSASDLEDPVVLNSLKQQSIQAQMAKMPRQIGVAQPKAEKEIKSNQKSMAEYREHVANLAQMGNVLDKIKLLNRSRIGAITPDFSVDTQAYSSTLDRAAQPMIKTLAGPGTLQKEERDTYGKLVPTGNTRSDLALRQANDIIVDGTNRALSLMNADLNTGDISRKDYDALINEYNEQLSKKSIGINQIINPSTGRLEARQKKEVTLKNGEKAIVDQFGYIWE